MSSNHYCTYLTIYTGNKLPPFYIGSSTVDRVNNGYHGSVQSVAYAKVWRYETRHNPHLFKTRIISTHKSHAESLKREHDLHTKLNVVENDLYTNKAVAFGHFDSGVAKEARRKQGKSLSKTMNNPEWKSTMGKTRGAKISATRNSDEWKSTVGEEMFRKRSELINSEEWKLTVEVERVRKIVATRSTTEWQDTVGAEQRRKISEKKLSKEWKETIGVEAYKKVSDSIKKTINSPEWKAAHYKTCEWCGIHCCPSNFKKYHGDNCKKNPTSPRYVP